MSKTVAFSTLGCKVNQYDTQAMLEQFEQQGYTVLPASAAADVYVVNTCTVTGTGDKKSLQLARRFRRRNPQAELIITGCLAQRMGAELRDTGARLILGTQYRVRVVELLEQAIVENTQLVAVDSLERTPFEPLTIHSNKGHTRAVMKIQEGCDNHCTYCIIPSVRGNVRSRPLDDIRSEAAALAKAGFMELVLTGIHLTSYGRDLSGEPTLAQAAQAACEAAGIERVRLGSLEPRVASDNFIADLRMLPQICPQFHLALQSGSDAVLGRMKRGYNTTQFLDVVDRIRAAYPNAAFTTDVIVGFPAETNDEFEQTVHFCEKIGFAKIHVFPYSKREGTPAAAMTEQVSQAVKEQRVHKLIAVGEACARAYRESLLGTVRQVLLEEKTENGAWAGYTPEYVHVCIPTGEAGALVSVRLDALTQEGMSGMIME